VRATQKSNTNAATESSPYLPSKNHTQGAVFIVHRQPIALDRLAVHDVQTDLAGTATFAKKNRS